ncbi:phage late control D family protein [Vibrio fluvialis]|uniref:phage late control D family protein n=1 Tax=Vibrio fluvialis TaxID=676 RepID=UPI001C9C3B7B|nr:phage late control D family protein [Vibrio fluvialis]MBY7859789.1 phage late control D family protein [Vibrio fluvialis]MBY7925032.1 phage late control D family protein [Vibrio fluvialis]MBY7980823.1 phage late control D family protein [Vibrio fluvialis]MBY8233188.1 phage late control D family protein [Vibrio fluvialis]
MGLATRIVARTTGPGSSVINRYLQSWELTDVSGEETDQVVLKVAAPSLDSLPPEGERIGFELGTSETEPLQWFDRGQFIITRITPQLFPHTVTIVATAAPFQVSDPTAFKERRSQSYSGTLGDIFRTVVKRHGLSPRVDPDLDGIAVAHIDQTDETDMSFLTRVARSYEAVAKPVRSMYVLSRRGKVKSLTGMSIPLVTIDLPVDNQPTASSFTNARLSLPSRQQFKGVKAVWWNDGTGEEVVVSVGVKPFKKLTQTYPDAGTAKQAASDELRKITRKGTQIFLDLPARPDFHAEGLVQTSGRFPLYMQGQWSLDKVVLTGDKQGSRASLVATLSLL